MTIGKTIALTRCIFVGKVMSLLFNMLSRFVIAFLPRSKCLLHTHTHTHTHLKQKIIQGPLAYKVPETGLGQPARIQLLFPMFR